MEHIIILLFNFNTIQKNKIKLNNNMNKNLLIWIPGYSDYYNHEHIKDKIPIFKNFNIIELTIENYTINTKNPYSENDFSNYILIIDKQLEKIELKNYKKNIFLYGHSMGSLLAILYLKYGKYSSKFNALILNDPFLFPEFNKLIHKLLFTLIKNYPFSNKNINNTDNLHKIINKINIKCEYRSYLNNFNYIHNNFIKINLFFNVHFFIESMKIQKKIFNEQYFLNNFPILLLIANGSEFRKNRNYLGNLLNKDFTINGKNISKNVIYESIDGTYHDVFFPENIDTFNKINDIIENFINKIK